MWHESIARYQQRESKKEGSLWSLKECKHSRWMRLRALVQTRLWLIQSSDGRNWPEQCSLPPLLYLLIAIEGESVQTYPGPSWTRIFYTCSLFMCVLYLMCLMLPMFYCKAHWIYEIQSMLPCETLIRPLSHSLAVPLYMLHCPPVNAALSGLGG